MAMGGHAGIGVVIVMPTFAVGDQGHPPVVATFIRRLVVPIAPNVAGRVNEPGGVQHKAEPRKHTPNEERRRHEWTI